MFLKTKRRDFKDEMGGDECQGYEHAGPHWHVLGWRAGMSLAGGSKRVLGSCGDNPPIEASCSGRCAAVWCCGHTVTAAHSRVN